MKQAAWTAGALGMGFLGAVGVAAVGLEVGAAGLVVGFLLATIPVPFYVALALWIDRYEKEPLSMLALAFFWGATAAFFFALVFNSINGAILHEVGGARAAQVGTPVFSAPLVEELAKGVALFLLFFWKHDEFDNVTDGVVYAAMVGLGFAMSENILYYGQSLEAGLGGPVVVFLMRGVLAPFAHPLYTALTGIGLGIARETHGPARWVAPPLGLAGAMILHSLWNLAAAAGGGVFLLVYALLMFPVFVAVIAIVVWSLKREGAILRTHLAPHVEAGVLSPAEIETLASVRARTRRSIDALRNGGVPAWRHRRAIHQTASELAFHGWRTSRGISRGPDADARREARHLEQLRTLRGVHPGPGRGAVPPTVPPPGPERSPAPPGHPDDDPHAGEAP
ncbi:MAG TPA: PrsW family intramembrane metalloprotease [Gemmatimonadota bacterium]|nr:PrsW family intramembrane metalloprotease [Gemmatimonadota bacterium]